jgi:hypothetical protein
VYNAITSIYYVGLEPTGSVYVFYTKDIAFQKAIVKSLHLIACVDGNL